MLKSLSEFQSLTGVELADIVEQGPLLVTYQEEPRFVAQSVEEYEAMVKRIRQLESIRKKRADLRLARVIPLPSVTGGR